jgi:hypothetical protein
MFWLKDWLVQDYPYEDGFDHNDASPSWTLFAYTAAGAACLIVLGLASGLI